VGILTNRDLRFERNVSQPVSDLMTARDLVTAPIGTTHREAGSCSTNTGSRSCRSSTRTASLCGLITVKDIAKRVESRTRPRTRRVACASAQPSASALTRSSARRRCSQSVRTCCRRHRPRALARRDRDGRPHRRPVREFEVIAGNISTGAPPRR
jgi:IMP dehydrogenase